MKPGDLVIATNGKRVLTEGLGFGTRATGYTYGGEVCLALATNLEKEEVFVLTPSGKGGWQFMDTFKRA